MDLILDRVTFSYQEGGKPVLNRLSAQFPCDAVTVLAGPSGCGKSTLLFLAAGLYPRSAGFLTEGRVSIGGADPGALSPEKRCLLTGLMFQNPELQFCMDTVEHELAFCLENIALPPEEMPARMAEALDFAGLAPLKSRPLLTLSGGQRQRAMLACLYAIGPKWLLLDEPFANLDDASARAIAAKLRELHEKKGTGILAVDHRLDNWMGAADRVVLLEDGALSAPMAPAALDAAAFARTGVILPGRPYRAPVPPSPPGPAALTLEGLTVYRGKEKVLDGLSASFDRGRIHAVIGPSGCGKSTLFGALAGLWPWQGRILAEGRPVRRRHPIPALGFVTQNPQDQFVSGTVKGEILAGLAHRPAGERADRTEEILRSIGLWRYRDVSPYMLSQGQQRRLGVAALLAMRCSILVCDEPTYAQDFKGTVAIMDELVRRTKEEDLCLLLSTHDPALARDYADVIWHMEGGRLYAQSEPRL